jgi:ferredoxin
LQRREFTDGGGREGSLDAPTRHPINWRDPAFYDQDALEQELHRVFDICHGCRRCFSLCQSFPILFDAIDASPTMELDGVDKRVYWQVVENCYLCDMCYMTKCPYVPPHPVERGLSAPDAARQGAAGAARGSSSSPTAAQFHRCGRAHRRHSGGGRNRQRRQPQRRGAQAARSRRSGSTRARRCRSITRAPRAGA